MGSLPLPNPPQTSLLPGVTRQWLAEQKQSAPKSPRGVASRIVSAPED